MAFCLFSSSSDPFWKVVYSKRKEFAPMGSKVFPFRVDPISEGRKNSILTVASPESVSMLLKHTVRKIKKSDR